MRENKSLIYIERDPSLYQSNYMGLFDLSKGIMMLAIILLHCANHYYTIIYYDGGDNIFVRLLLSPMTVLTYGGVPMLFMICGYGIRKQRPLRQIKNQLSYFILPYICVIVSITALIMLRNVLAGRTLGAGILNYIMPFLLGYHPGAHLLKASVVQIGPIWFFWTYTFGSIYLNLVLQEKRGWAQALILTAGAVVGVALRKAILPFCLQQILICSGFMYLGMQLKRWQIPRQKIPAFAFFLVYVLCSIARGLGGMAEIANNVYAIGAEELILACLAGVVLLCLFLRLNVLQGLVPDALRWLGRHMMWVCCVHSVAELAMPWKRFGSFFVNCPAVGIVLDILFNLLFAVLGSLLLSRLVKTVFMPGQRRLHGRNL